MRAILVNIFGGIMRCDIIALGLIAAATQLGLKKPVVIRLQGTNVEEAKRLIEESGLRMLTADDLGEAAQKVVRVVDILKMAEDAHVKVHRTCTTREHMHTAIHHRTEDAHSPTHRAPHSTLSPLAQRSPAALSLPSFTIARR